VKRERKQEALDSLIFETSRSERDIKPVKPRWATVGGGVSDRLIGGLDVRVARDGSPCGGGEGVVRFEGVAADSAGVAGASGGTGGEVEGNLAAV
jgi:hypothetical protein